VLQIRLLAELLRLGSLSAASEKIGLSQPAAGHALACNKTPRMHNMHTMQIEDLHLTPGRRFETTLKRSSMPIQGSTGTHVGARV